MNSPRNPYVAGRPVGDTPAFVGRRDHIDEIRRMVEQRHRRTVALFGARGSGKTSLLRHLAARLGAEDRVLPVYFDLHDKVRVPLGQTVLDLAWQIAAVLELTEVRLGPDAETAFLRDWFPAILDSLAPDRTLVVLFDEFAAPADAEQRRARDAFFAFLRPLVESPPERVVFVFALGRDIHDLTREGTELFRLLPLRRVGPLAPQEIDELAAIAESQGVLTWEPSALAAVREQTAGQPVLVQHVLYHLWERARREREEGDWRIPSVDAAQVTASLEAVADEATAAMEWLWQGLPPGCRWLASQLARREDGWISQEDLDALLESQGPATGESLAQAPQLLRGWNLLAADQGGYRLWGPLLRHWIRENKRRVSLPTAAPGGGSRADRYLETARTLWDEVRTSSAEEDLQPVLALARRALREDPEHVAALELLAEVLLARGDPAAGLEQAEHLRILDPERARRLLVPYWLGRADAASTESERLTAFEKVLAFEGHQPDAVAGRRGILRGRAGRCFEAGDLQAALRYYEAAGLDDEADRTRRALRHRQARRAIEAIEAQQRAGEYAEALLQLEEAASRFPEEDCWGSMRNELEQAVRLRELFEEGREALGRGDYEAARQAFSEITYHDPTYPEAARYLFQAVSGDPATRSAALPPSPQVEPEIPDPGFQEEPEHPEASAPGEPASYSLAGGSLPSSDRDASQPRVRTSPIPEATFASEPAPEPSPTPVQVEASAPESPPVDPEPAPEGPSPEEPMEAMPPVEGDADMDEAPTQSYSIEAADESATLEDPGTAPASASGPAVAGFPDDESIEAPAQPGLIEQGGDSDLADGIRAEVSAEASAKARAFRPPEVGSPSSDPGEEGVSPAADAGWEWESPQDPPQAAPHEEEDDDWLEEARSARRSGSPWLWLIAAAVGVVILFAIYRFSGSSTPGPAPEAETTADAGQAAGIPEDPAEPPAAAPAAEGEEPPTGAAGADEEAPSEAAEAEPEPEAAPSEPAPAPSRRATRRTSAGSASSSPARSPSSAPSPAPSSPWGVSRGSATAPSRSPAPVAGADSAVRGSFSITSDPVGATVELDGKSIGNTPLSSHETTEGDHVFRLTLEGHQPMSFMGTIKAGQNVDLGSFDLPPEGE